MPGPEIRREKLVQTMHDYADWAARFAEECRESANSLQTGSGTQVATMTRGEAELKALRLFYDVNARKVGELV